MYLLRHHSHHGLSDNSAVLMSRPNCFAHHPSKEEDNKTVYRSIDAHANESDNQFTLTMDLPGVKPDKLTVQVADGLLTVSADRPTANGSVVAYRSRFAVDENTVDAGEVKASLADGVLTLTLPKKEEAKPIELPVMGGEAAGTTEEDLRITFDVPGFKAADIKVVVHNGMLTIKGEHKKGNSISRIQRTIMLDRHCSDLTQSKAYLAHGVLTFTAPHTEQGVTKTVQLNALAEQPQQNVTVVNVPAEGASVKL
jgi:HSP20 family protein